MLVLDGAPYAALGHGDQRRRPGGGRGGPRRRAGCSPGGGPSPARPPPPGRGRPRARRAGPPGGRPGHRRRGAPVLGLTVGVPGLVDADGTVPLAPTSAGGTSPSPPTCARRCATRTSPSRSTTTPTSPSWPSSGTAAYAGVANLVYLTGGVGDRRRACIADGRLLRGGRGYARRDRPPAARPGRAAVRAAAGAAAWRRWPGCGRGPPAAARRRQDGPVTDYLPEIERIVAARPAPDDPAVLAGLAEIGRHLGHGVVAAGQPAQPRGRSCWADYFVAAGALAAAGGRARSWPPRTLAPDAGGCRLAPPRTLGHRRRRRGVGRRRLPRRRRTTDRRPTVDSATELDPGRPRPPLDRIDALVPTSNRRLVTRAPGRHVFRGRRSASPLRADDRHSPPAMPPRHHRLVEALRQPAGASTASPPEGNRQHERPHRPDRPRSTHASTTCWPGSPCRRRSACCTSTRPPVPAARAGRVPHRHRGAARGRLARPGDRLPAGGRAGQHLGPGAGAGGRRGRRRRGPRPAPRGPGPASASTSGRRWSTRCATRAGAATRRATSEDPWLTGVLATAYARGLRGDHPRPAADRADAQALPRLQQRDRPGTTSSDLPPRVLHEYELPAFRAPLAAGAAVAVMASYNLVNGVPGAPEPAASTTSCAAGPPTRCWWSATPGRPTNIAGDAGLPARPRHRLRRRPAGRHRQLHRGRRPTAEPTVDRLTEALRPRADHRGRHRPRGAGGSSPSGSGSASSTRPSTDPYAGDHRRRASTAPRTSGWPGRPPAQSIVLLRNDGLLPLPPTRRPGSRCSARSPTPSTRTGTAAPCRTR